MLSWSPRHLLSFVVAAVLGLAVLVVPSGAQAAGGQIGGGAPGVVSTQEPARVTQQKIPTEPVAQRAEPHAHDHDHEHEVPEADHVVAELTETGMRPFSMLGVTWTSGLEDDKTLVEARWRSGDGAWSDWTELHVDPAGGEGVPGTEPQWVDRADAAAVRVLSTADAEPKGLALSTVDPRSPDTATTSETASSAVSADDDAIQAAATVAKPAIISRSKWGASNTGSCDSPIYGKATKGAVIHHTAGSNSYTKAKSASIVKSTQAYHKNSRKWCDIGYNFLVDKYGQIFEGRAGGVTKSVRAAHSGNGPVNEQTTGISLMGTFTDTSPTAAMKSAVVELTAWKLALHGAPATGTYSLGGKTLHRIAGHRNVVSTACPGAKVYSWLTSTSSDGLRQRVAQVMKSGSVADPLPTPTGLEVAERNISSVSLDWDDVEGAEKYHVKVSKSSSMSSPTYGKFTDNKGTVTGLEPGTKYYFSVAVVDPDRNVRLSDYSGAPHPTTTTYPKATPTGAKATTTPTTLSLDWDDVPGAEKYHVKVSKSSSMSSPTFGKFTESKGTVTGLTAGTRYYYSIVVVDPVRNVRLGDYSAPVAITLPTTGGGSGKLPTPSNLDVRVAKQTLVAFTWDAVAGAEKYHVKVSTSSSMSKPIYGKFTTNRGNVTGLKPGTKYYYAVAVVDPNRNVLLSDYTKAPYQSVTTKSSSSETSTAANTVKVPSSRTVSFTGHGYGHGIGMSQYGAEGAARSGEKYSKILAHYYRGTDLTNKSGDIRVMISADTTDGVTITGRSGLKLRDISGKRTITLPTEVGGKAVDRWEIRRTDASASRSKLVYRTTGTYKNFTHGGKALTWSGEGQFTGPASISLVLPGGSTMKLRGDVRSAKPSSGSSKRDTVNVLPLDAYVRGVIAAEMPSSWHSEALKAQAVAARTYGARSMGSSGHYDICSTTSCQVYGGVSRETASTDSAVKATAGKILTYKGAVALTQFSSSSGGYSNQGSQPYLKPVSDPWDGWSGNKNHSWTIKVKASTIEKKYASIGTLKSLQVTKRNGYGSMGGRVSSLKLVGSKASKTITGVDARWAFGLRSDWFGF